jgi:hypothetical protein
MAALLGWLGAFANAQNSDAYEIPSWVGAHVESQAEVLSSLIGLPRTPFLTMRHRGPVATTGLRTVHGRAEPERFTIELAGDWTKRHPDARRQLTRNVAHETAHVLQYTMGEPIESRMLHEGFAEAMAVEALIACGEGCAGDGHGLERKLRRQCGEALRNGILVLQSSVDSDYGCGGVLTLEGARAAGMPVTQLYRLFVAAGRNEEAMMQVLEEHAGRGFAISAKAFLRSDYRLARPSDVFSRLQAGRL